MGKAQITADLGGGLYRVDLLLNVDSTDDIARINGVISALQAKIAADPDSIEAKIYALRIEAYQKKIDELESYEAESPRDAQAWLADYPDSAPTPPAVGDIVGTIEIDREDNADTLNIYPAFAGAHLFDPDRDGILTPVALQNPFWRYFNLAVSPGVQKWYPRYRHAEITEIDYSAGTCTISMEPAYAAAGAGEDPLYINQDAETLYDVPIDYMDCDTPPFIVGDLVIVSFTDLDWNQPKVIGYKTDPQPCAVDELVLFSLGELGIIWDVTEDDYPVDFVGVQDYADCLAYLAGKTETTHVDPYFGLPYKRLLRCFYTDAAYNDYHEKITTWGLVDDGEVPGYLYDKPQLSDQLIGPVSGVYERRIEWDETATPWGTIRPAYLNNYFYEEGFSGPVFLPGGVNLYSWSIWDYFDSHYVCPLDEDPTYYSFGTDAEYGNDAIGMGCPGAVMSDSSIVQVTFSSHAYTETIDPGTGLEVVYTSARETVTACTCGRIPFSDGMGGEITDPQQMPKNVGFSAAVYDLVEALHNLRGVEIMYDSPDYDTETCPGPGLTVDNCAASLCNYWRSVVNPKMELKLYRKA